MGGGSGRGSVSWKAGGIQRFSEYTCPHVTSSSEGISVLPQASSAVTFAHDTALVLVPSVAAGLGLMSGASPCPASFQAISAWPSKRPWSRGFRVIVSLRG